MDLLWVKTAKRGIWKVLSMVFYLSNLFTNPIMFGTMLKRYLSSMLWHKFHEDIIMQTGKNIIVNTCTYCLYTGKRIILLENITLKSVQNITVVHEFR